MGFGSSSQSSARNRSTPSSLAEINVTPLVDVMLVLLIVFMISAPLMQQGIQVDLPKANAGNMNEVPDPLILSIDQSRQIFIGEQAIPSGTLFQKLKAIANAKPAVEMVIQADQGIPYGFVAQVMADVKRSGIHRVGLATTPGNSPSKL